VDFYTLNMEKRVVCGTTLKGGNSHFLA